MHTQSRHKLETTTLLFKTSTQLASQVRIGRGLLKNTVLVLQQIASRQQVLLVYQSSVQKHAQCLIETLKTAGVKVNLHPVPDAEEGKTAQQLLKLWEFMQQVSIERKDCLIAIGGGVLCDLAGFAASTYLRGVKLILIPTTLLAQVDAAIGGKTGINLSSGKNLAGTFYLPQAVMVDPDLLLSLPEKQVRSGFGEIIKYGLIEQTIATNTDYKPGPRPFLKVVSEYLLDQAPINNPGLEGIITTCIKMKLAVVGKDFHEENLRRCLNLGHTVGHGIEKASNYQILHGEAIAAGMVIAARLAVQIGRLNPAELKELEAVLQATKLPTQIPPSLDRQLILDAIQQDKKRQSGKIKFVLPVTTLGTVDIDFEVTAEELANLL